ncbi:MAG: AAA family ATPase, partial [Actinomycetota bacterium]|nr:AAA family ATPase [Actinomycetota bacterium]
MTETSNTDAAAGGPSFTQTFRRIADNIAQVIRGKDDAVNLALICLVAEGHLLVEDVPGVGKTSLAKTLAASIDCSFGRVQFTPDVLPTDVVGVNIWNEHERVFEFRAGPVFNNIVLGDEINRASPKTQAALLEAMEERQVTVDRTTHPLARPFMVLATQNPIEHEGTYPLPESQLDRFLMRITMGYPDRESALDILDTHDGTNAAAVGPVATVHEVMAMVETVKTVHVAPSLKEYIISIAEASRAHHALALGVSPRATLNLQRVSQAVAAAAGRAYVVPDDIKAVA